MSKRSKFTVTLFLTAWVFFAVFLIGPRTEAAAAPSIKMKWKLTGQSSVKITWSGGKKLKYWRIRKAYIDKDGKQHKYKTVKVIKRSKKSYTVKKLKKDSEYVFEITGGIKKNGKYKAISEYEYIWPLYTGCSEIAWDDYAVSDAPCSPTNIHLWGSGMKNGFPIRGYQIYRKKVGASKYTRIATIKTKKLSFKYKDKKVTKGASYRYKFRAYTIWKKKKLYSPFSDVMMRSAVNQVGNFTSKLVSSAPDELIIKLTSAKYNADLILNHYGLSIVGDVMTSEAEPYEDSDYPPVIISAYSTDNNTWTDLGEGKGVTLKSGDSVYLKIKTKQEGIDLSKGTSLTSDNVTYDRLPCFFDVDLDGTGTARQNGEYIH